MIFCNICIFFHFNDLFVKKSLMNKSFVNEKYTFLPNFIFIDQKINDLWQAEHLVIFFHLLWHLATSSRICTSNRILSAFIWEYCTYISNFMSIGWKITKIWYVLEQKMRAPRKFYNGRRSAWIFKIWPRFLLKVVFYS